MENFQFRLAIDGDDIERYYWGFIKDYFPSYESFWLKYTVPLTNRPQNIHFKTDAELAKINKSIKDLCMAQLSYSAITNLGRCFDILNILKSITKNIIEQRNLLTEGFVRLVGSQDNIFELLERKTNPTYNPFNSISSRTARENWRKNDGYPLDLIRKYRNNLVHGRTHPCITGVENEIWFMKIGTEEKYLDWRIVTSRCEGNETEFAKVKEDFISPWEVLEKALNETTTYFESHFKNL